MYVRWKLIMIHHPAKRTSAYWVPPGPCSAGYLQWLAPLRSYRSPAPCSGGHWRTGLDDSTRPGTGLAAGQGGRAPAILARSPVIRPGILAGDFEVAQTYKASM